MAQLFFEKPEIVKEIRPKLEPYLKHLLGPLDIEYISTAELTAKRDADLLEEEIKSPKRFNQISFGSDVAEKDTALLGYFISTKTFSRVNSGQASVVIGPKGSGKSSILKAIANHRGSKNSIIITPEIFATSMLRQVVDSNREVWDEDQAFVSTWIFTILIEVFKRVAEDPQGVPSAAQKRLKVFLRDNANYGELDIFTRFIGYLKKIEGVKIGNYELTIKTKMLQELYSLSAIYELVPMLRGVGGQITILLDELDQGWDNSPHANRFIASLLKAAIKIQGLGIKACVIAFLRSEIFDLIKDQLDQLDKLRSSIETIKWSEGELSDLITKRIAHSLSFPYHRTGHEMRIISSLFDSNIDGRTGFEHILSRTSLRPREVLQFISHAHRLATDDGLHKIPARTLLQAEQDFSLWKYEHLGAEYAHIYPKLRDLVMQFRAKGPVVQEADIQDAIVALKMDRGESTPPWLNTASKDIIHILYSVEFLGVLNIGSSKTKGGLISQYEFSYQRRTTSVRLTESFLIHPAFWMILEISNCD